MKEKQVKKGKTVKFLTRFALRPTLWAGLVLRSYSLKSVGGRQTEAREPCSSSARALANTNCIEVGLHSHTLSLPYLLILEPHQMRKFYFIFTSFNSWIHSWWNAVIEIWPLKSLSWSRFSLLPLTNIFLLLLVNCHLILLKHKTASSLYNYWQSLAGIIFLAGLFLRRSILLTTAF